jgi:hypothetical protein
MPYIKTQINTECQFSMTEINRVLYIMYVNY